MKTNFVRAAFAAVLLSTTALTAAHAADNKVSKDVAVQLSAAQKAIQAQDFKTALTAVQAAQAVPNQTDFDTYTINQFAAQVDIGLKDMDGADKAEEAAADSPSLASDDANKKIILTNALLLSGNAQHWQKVVTYAQQLEAMGPLTDQEDGIVAVAYYNIKDIPNAKKYAQLSIDAAKAAGKQPDENAMKIVMSSQAATDQGAAEATLEQIVMNFNRPDDWDQLVGVSLGTKGLSNADALNMYRLLYIQGPMKTADDYNYMGNLAEDQRNSVEARNVLQAGVSAGKIGSSAVLGKARGEAAGDEKIISQAMAAAQKSKRGEDGMQVAQDLWGYGRYSDVEAMATDAKSKGGIKDPGEAAVLIGMAQIAQKKYDAGIATLATVSGTPGRMRTAHLWTLYAQASQKQAGGAAPAH